MLHCSRTQTSNGGFSNVQWSWLSERPPSHFPKELLHSFSLLPSSISKSMEPPYPQHTYPSALFYSKYLLLTGGVSPLHIKGHSLSSHHLKHLVPLRSPRHDSLLSPAYQIALISIWYAPLLCLPLTFHLFTPHLHQAVPPVIGKLLERVVCAVADFLLPFPF